MPQIDIPVHPVQKSYTRETAYCPQTVTLRAYEVYKELHGEQKALITNNCRGGFSSGELIAFLYAHSFSKSEWRARADEAFTGAKNL